MIVAPGIGSGLDINSIVGQLIALERRPINQINQRESGLQSQLSDIGRLKGALSSFQSAMSALSDPSKFKIFTAASGDEDAFSASADDTAAIGNTNVEVQQLAEAHKLASAAFTDSDSIPTSNLNFDMSIQVGLDVNDTFSISISGATLSEIRDSINGASDNTGVTATILNDDAGSRLVLTSDETGTSNALSVSFTENGLPAPDPFGLSEVSAAADAGLTVDGFTVTSASNEVKDVIEGVTLSLKQVTSGPVQLSVGRDDEQILESVQSFADEFNNLRGLINDLRGGALQGDSTLLSIERGLLNQMSTSASGSGNYSFLSEIGVSIQKDGTLAVDADDVVAAMGDDFSGFAGLFSLEDVGFAARLDNWADNLLSTDNGLIQIRSDGISTRIDTLDGQRERLERRVDATEIRLRSEFAALDTLLGQLQNTSAFLTQQLGRVNS